MLFRSENRSKSARHESIYAMFEILYTVVDFAAAVFFIIGSVMFFYEEWMTTGTWLFVVGSFFFAMKPALRLIRELKLASIGDTEALAKRYKS